MTRALPRSTPETRHFWEGTRQGELRLQRCRACARTWFPPQPLCPGCGERAIEVFAASGRACLHSYVINQRAAPGHTAPYVIAVVDLEEGPRMLTRLVEIEPVPEALPLDLPLEVVFESASDEITLPLFRPRRGNA